MKPIRRSDGKCYDSATEAAREMVAETGAGNLQTALANITAVARGDSFRKSAYGYGWTYGEPLGGGKLTAEQVMAIAGKHQPDYCSDTHVCFDWQAIADELNAALGGGECEVECFDDGVDEGMDGEWFSYAPPTWYLSCGHEVQGTERPNYCVVCGKAVKR